MKKSFLFIGLFAAVVAFSACCGKSGNKKDESKCALTEEQCKAKAEFEVKWAKFDSLTIEEQEVLIAQRVECFTKCREKAVADTAKCAKKKACCKEKDAELTAEQKVECEAKKAELETVWANFAELTLAEKKAFFDKIDCCKAKAEKKCCKKESEKKCCKKNSEKK